MAKHIVAIGGQGLTEPLMREFLFGLTGKPRPRVLFIPTATGDDRETMLSFYQSMASHDCRPSHVLLFQREHEDLTAIFLEQDLIYVGGGNTANMLAVWRVHGVDQLLRQAWEAGIVLAGASAGSLCWFECGITDSFGKQLAPLHDGLAFLPGSNCPHYDSEERRRPVYTAAVAAGFPAGLAAQDAVGLHFVDRQLSEVVAARPQKQAFRVAAEAGHAVETAVPARYLG